MLRAHYYKNSSTCGRILFLVVSILCARILVYHNMVMESELPQNIGREFVRQYYTLLHSAPEYLHRFYSQDSSFVHGGVEKPGEEQPPITGQTAINNKINSLNFKDCHAKIRQVDSQLTVNDAVVIQVTGELSNNGEPMRRFMQTFILVPLAPKKYYVKNDIFRYQDEVFHDIDDVDDDVQHDAVDSSADLEAPDAPIESPPAVGANYYSETTSSVSTTSTAAMNGNVHADEQQHHVEAPVIEPEPVPQPAAEESPKAKPVVPEPAPAEVEPVVAEPAAPAQPEPQERATTPVQATQSQASNEPVSWAALAAKSSGAPAASTLPQPSQAAVPKPVAKAPEPATNKSDAAPPQPQRAPRGPRMTRDTRSMEGNNHESNDNFDRVQKSRYADSQQIFVGNLPQNVTEAQLKDYFGAIVGDTHVIESRINKKAANPNIAGFGFVVFDDEKYVQQILQNKNTYPPLENHRLNIEEKKNREMLMYGRPNGGNRSMPRNMMGGRGNNMGRRGGRGGGDMRAGRQSYGGGGQNMRN